MSASPHLWNLCLSLLASVGLGCAQQGPTHQQRWQALARLTPLELPELGAQASVKQEVVADDPDHKFAVIRLSAQALIQAFHAENPCAALCAEQWSRSLAAPNVVWNAGFYGERGRHLGWLRAGGRWRTSARHPQWQGVLLSAPRDPSLPAWQLLDAQRDDVASHIETLVQSYDTVVQTMVLLDESGALRVNANAKKSARTVLARDAGGQLLLFVSERAISLPALAAALMRWDPPLALVVNLDGGLESQLAITDAQGEGVAVNARHGASGAIAERWSGRVACKPLPSVLAVTLRPEEAP